MSSSKDANLGMSTTDSLSRFMIARDVADFVEREGGVIDGNTYIDTIPLDLPTHPIGAYDAYERLFFQETIRVMSYYRDPALFLKNLYLDRFIQSVSAYIDHFVEALARDKSHKKTLLFVHLPPIDLALLAIVLDRSGVKNITCNFNRAPVVNGVSKTLEAHLLLLAAGSNPRLIEALTPLVKKLPRDIASYDIILDENDTPVRYDIAQIDGYIAQAIGFKEHQVVLRTEEYPDVHFLGSQKIEEVRIFDIDDTSGFDTFYGSTLLKGGIHVNREVIRYGSLHRDAIPESSFGDVGVYEGYVVDKNQSYLTSRRQQREATAVSAGGTNKYQPKKSPSVKNDISDLAHHRAQKDVTKKQAGLAVGTLATLMIFLFIIDARQGAPLFAERSSYKLKTGGSSSSSSSSWGSAGGWTSGSSSSPSSYSSKSSSSKSVSSFGGGGFSKGGG